MCSPPQPTNCSHCQVERSALLDLSRSLVWVTIAAFLVLVGLPEITAVIVDNVFDEAVPSRHRASLLSMIAFMESALIGVGYLARRTHGRVGLQCGHGHLRLGPPAGMSPVAPGALPRGTGHHRDGEARRPKGILKQTISSNAPARWRGRCSLTCCSQRRGSCLGARGVEVMEGPVPGLLADGGALRGVDLADGRTLQTAGCSSSRGGSRTVVSWKGFAERVKSRASCALAPPGASAAPVSGPSGTWLIHGPRFTTAGIGATCAAALNHELVGGVTERDLRAHRPATGRPFRGADTGYSISRSSKPPTTWAP